MVSWSGAYTHAGLGVTEIGRSWGYTKAAPVLGNVTEQDTQRSQVTSMCWTRSKVLKLCCKCTKFSSPYRYGEYATEPFVKHYYSFT